MQGAFAKQSKPFSFLCCVCVSEPQFPQQNPHEKYAQLISLTIYEISLGTYRIRRNIGRNFLPKLLLESHPSTYILVLGLTLVVIWLQGSPSGPSEPQRHHRHRHQSNVPCFFCCCCVAVSGRMCATILFLLKISPCTWHQKCHTACPGQQQRTQPKSVHTTGLSSRGSSRNDLVSWAVHFELKDEVAMFVSEHCAKTLRMYENSPKTPAGHQGYPMLGARFQTAWPCKCLRCAL